MCCVAFVLSFRLSWRSGPRALAMLCALVMAVSTFTVAPGDARADEGGNLWHPWFELGGFYNSREDARISATSGSRGETTLFSPIQGGARDLIFSQLTAKFFADEAREGNFAIGYRRMMRNGFNLGGWFGGDVRKTGFDNRFWQLSGGFEALSGPVDFRANWYGPVTDPQASGTSAASVFLAGNQLFLVGGEEVGMRGVDGEIGVRLPLDATGLDPDLYELRAYGGGYYFDHEDALEEIAGVKGRLDLRINDVAGAGSRLSLQYEVTHDDVRSTRHDVGLRLRIPLNGDDRAPALASLSDQQRRMLDGIQRDTDIVIGRSKAEEVEDALTGTDFDRVAYASPSQDVTATSAAAGGNSLVIANGTVSGGQILQANQTLQGGGSTIAVRGRRSGVVVPFTAPGTPGQLTSPAVDIDNLVLAGSNTHVSGLTVVGGGPSGRGDGIDVNSDKSNVFLTNLLITNTGGDGIDIDDNSTVTILNLTTRDTDESGVDVNDMSTVSIVGASITRTDSDGIQISDENTVVIRNVTITDTSEDGIDIIYDNNIVVDNVTISGSSDDGFFAEARNSIEISNSSISNVFNDAINLEYRNTLTVTSTTLSFADFGVVLEYSHNVATITDTTFSNINTVAVLIDDDDNTARIIGSTFDTVGVDVIGIDPSGPATLFFAGNTVTGNVGSFIFGFQSGVTTVETGSTGNTNTATVGVSPCVATSGAFTGFIGFDGGLTLVDNAAPCN